MFRLAEWLENKSYSMIHKVSRTFAVSRVSMHVPTIPRGCSLARIEVDEESRLFAR